VTRADSGELIWVASRGRYFYDNKERPARLIGALFNINHRKHAEAEIERLLNAARIHERELREKQAQLVQSAKLASIGEFATGLAHELNNPLNNIGLIIGNALEVIAEEVTEPLKDRLFSDLKRGMEQVNRGAAIISHLRVFARTGKENFEPLNINSIIVDASRFTGEQMRLAGIECLMQLESRSPIVDGCRIQLEQVLVNLMTNAIDAVKDADIKRIFVSSQINCQEVLIRVNDTGTGIAAENIMRIFDPFFTTKDVGLGTGLGLSISFGIVKEHHGEITVESTIGNGTEFTVRLPVSKTVATALQDP
jgi:C4-dicarboxylate-specific signal transduction histidine kinase